MEWEPDIAQVVVERTFVATAIHHATIDSTNNEARRLAQSGPTQLPLLVLADTQTAGRGRGGNRWWTGKGNLACSVLLRTDAWGVGPPQLHLLSLAAGVAVARAVTPLLGCTEPRIHWPNDVYAAGRKLAGVLVEIVLARYGIIGIGVNVNGPLREAPPDVARKATTLSELTGKQHCIADLLIALLEHLEQALNLLKDDPAELARCANQLCGQHGQQFTVQSGREVVEGTCAGIDPSGALLLDTAAGRRRLFSGVLLPDEPQGRPGE